MPVATCQVCRKKYHFAEKWAKTNPYYGPERCFDCSQGSTPESWALGVKHQSTFDSSPYKEGHFAHVLVRQSYIGDTGKYRRVRVREIHPNGSIITFCGKHFIDGEHTDKVNYTWTLQPLSEEIENVILKTELRDEINKLWDAHQDNLPLSALSNILETLRSC
jgi:hypothetical protein